MRCADAMSLILYNNNWWTILATWRAVRHACTVGGTEWVLIGADGSYRGLEWGCRAVTLTIVYRGDVIKGQPGANAVYGMDARCEGDGDSWRERARIEVERWGSALTIMRRKERGSKRATSVSCRLGWPWA